MTAVVTVDPLPQLDGAHHHGNGDHHRQDPSHHEGERKRGAFVGTHHLVASEDLTTRVVGARYELLEPLGRGGMGTVWRARDQLLEREVAVKEVHLPPSATDAERDEVHQRFLREARTSARLNHQHAVTVFDVVDQGDTIHLVMELVRGRTLTEAVQEHGPLEAAEAAEVGLALLGALEEAHGHGIVHRDLKPSNVMVPERGGVKLADFGIAVLTGDPRITRVGMVMGSPSYMSPEQAEGREAGPASDLWGLGALLYFAVEGRPPFDRGEALATLHAVVHGEPAPFRDDGALVPLILDLLSKSPADRPSLSETRRRLQEVVAGPAPASVVAPETTAPAPVPTQVAASTDGRSFPWLAVAAVVALFAVLAGVGIARSRDGAKRQQATATSDDSSPSSSTPPASEAPATTSGATPTGGAVPADWVRYTDQAIGYSIAHPPGWQVKKVDGTRTDIRDPRTGSYLRVDWTDKPGPSAVQAWRDFAPVFASRNSGYREIRIEPTTYKGFDAAIWEFTYRRGSTTLHAVDLGFVTGSHGFALNFQTAEASWRSSQPIFDAFKASFEVPSGR